MKRFTLFLALLLCGVGAMFGQTYDATKVYTIHKLAVQDRGYLAYHTDYTNSAGLGLAGVGLSGYVSKHKALTDITEHYAEEQYIRYGKYRSRVNLVKAWQSVHLNEHFKRLEYGIVFKLCRRLHILDVFSVFNIEHHNIA